MVLPPNASLGRCTSTKVTSVGPTYARCPLLSELALPGLSRRRVVAVWYPVKRRALIGSRDAQDHQAPPGEDNRSTPATTINDCAPQPMSSSLSPDRRASTMRDASLRRRRPQSGVASLTWQRGPSRRAQRQRRWRHQRSKTYDCRSLLPVLSSWACNYNDNSDDDAMTDNDNRIVSPCLDGLPGVYPPSVPCSTITPLVVVLHCCCHRTAVIFQKV